MSTEAGRNELFGGAAQRYQQQQQTGGYGQSGAYGGQQSGAYGDTGGDQSGYGAYQDRQLTAEEQLAAAATCCNGESDRWHT